MASWWILSTWTRQLDGVVGRYRDAMLNDLPEFAGLNPSLENFARILTIALADRVLGKGLASVEVVLWEDEVGLGLLCSPQLSWRRGINPQRMRAALVVYGSLDTMSGGYLYDRMLVSKLRLRGDEVQVISQRRRGYAGKSAGQPGRPVSRCGRIDPGRVEPSLVVPGQSSAAASAHREHCASPAIIGTQAHLAEHRLCSHRTPVFAGG